MLFSRRKFLAFPETQRAKKLADLLARWLRTGAPDALIEYNRLIALLEPPGTSLEPATRAVLAAYHHWRGLTGLGPERDLTRHLHPADRPAPAHAPFVWDVWAHDIRSGHNFGSIMRIVDCLGLRSVHRSGYTPSPEQAAVRAAAMGCETWIPCRAHADAENFFAWFESEKNEAKDRGQPPPRLVALETVPGAREPGDFDWPEAGVLVVGNEELGIDPAILGRCDDTIAIPMRGRKQSLNLSSALTIAAYELGRALSRRG